MSRKGLRRCEPPPGASAATQKIKLTCIKVESPRRRLDCLRFRLERPYHKEIRHVQAKNSWCEYRKCDCGLSVGHCAPSNSPIGDDGSRLWSRHDVRSAMDNTGLWSGNDGRLSNDGNDD